MKIPPIDIAYIKERFDDLAEDIFAVWDGDDLDADNKNSPVLIHAATQQLLDVVNDACCAKEKEVRQRTADRADLQNLGNYGLQLIAAMSAWAVRLQLLETARQLELLSFPFAIVNARLDIEISTLEPAVNALAYLANHINDPSELVALYRHIDELLAAIPPAISEDNQSIDPKRPWRILLFNRAIVATRSLQPNLMEPAFEMIVESLTDDSAMFFEQGMEQMDIIGYPDHVREVMQRFYQLNQKKHVLH